MGWSLISFYQCDADFVQCYEGPSSSKARVISAKEIDDNI
jgi:hypothetical protein